MKNMELRKGYEPVVIKYTLKIKALFRRNIVDGYRPKCNEYNKECSSGRGRDKKN